MSAQKKDPLLNALNGRETIHVDDFLFLTSSFAISRLSPPRSNGANGTPELNWLAEFICTPIDVTSINLFLLNQDFSTAS